MRPPASSTFGLSLDLELHGVVGVLEAVDVLQLDLLPERALARRPDADVRLAADVAFLHVRAAGPDVAQDLAQLHQVRARLLRRAHVRLGDDLHQRHAGAVDVDEA